MQYIIVSLFSNAGLWFFFKKKTPQNSQAKLTYLNF